MQQIDAVVERPGERLAGTGRAEEHRHDGDADRGTRVAAGATKSTAQSPPPIVTGTSNQPAERSSDIICSSHWSSAIAAPSAGCTTPGIACNTSPMAM